MGHINQCIFLSKICNISINTIKYSEGGEEIEFSILEIGSKDYGNTENFRSLFPKCHYIGVDIAEGNGVDVVIDLIETDPPAHWREGFDLIICCSILEHTPKPWILAQKLTDLLKKNGMIYISAPWVWRYHKYPDDYFRYSPSGVRSLFAQIEFVKTYFSTIIPGEFVDIGKDAAGKDDALALYKNIGQNRQRKYLPYLSVEMFGRKAE